MSWVCVVNVEKVKYLNDTKFGEGKNVWLFIQGYMFYYFYYAYLAKLLEFP